MQRPRGFTLLEVLVVLGVGAALLATGVASLAWLVGSARVAGAARTVATSLRLARERALAGGQAVEVRFDPASGAWAATDAAGLVLEARVLPPGVAFVHLPARRRVLFGGLGTGENATVTVGAGPRRRGVIVNQRGRVRVQ